MKNTIEQKIPTYAYYRLSKEDVGKIGESESIINQRSIVENYCNNNNYLIVQEFVDDGFSGSNFNRPEFQKMMTELEKGIVKVVIAKDLSRLGRDSRESSYYLESFFPENGIRFIGISDCVDSENLNSYVGFTFASNEMILRESSRKVREVLKIKRENGAYCACPPYGYKKKDDNKNQLVLDETTAPIVRRIFEEALEGYSARAIALKLSDDMIPPPLKHRINNGGNFGEAGASRASDIWSYTTVKRILKNQVYLGHTILGKTKKVSFRSKVKKVLPQEEWAITENTHEPIVTEEEFLIVQDNMLKNTKAYHQHQQIRKNIFSGLIFCKECGHALCSSGTVYKGKREKYWYLSCTNMRKGVSNPCTNGARIYYSDLVETIKDELNYFISLKDTEIDKMIKNVIERNGEDKSEKKRQKRVNEINKRLEGITKSIKKLYLDNASGLITDEQFNNLVISFNEENTKLKEELDKISTPITTISSEEKYKLFFNIVKNYNHITELNRDIVVDFIERIEVGAKVFPEGKKRATQKNTPYEQTIKIYYKFIGNDSF